MTISSYVTKNLHIHHSVDTVPAENQFFLHAHRTYELYYFISGDCYYTVEGTDYPLTPGCFLLIRSGEAHKLHLHSNVPYERITINFVPSIIPLLGKEIGELFCDRPLGKRNLYVPSKDSATFLNACMMKTSQEMANGNSEERIISNLMPVFTELYNIMTSMSDTDTDFNPPSQGSSKTVSKIIEYINANLVTIQGLDELEKEFFFSKSYINRIFKESTGSSVWDYIVLKRLLLSRSLLQSGKQANIVASECGFCDYSSFYRQFKQRFGISPLEARKTKN